METKSKLVVAVVTLVGIAIVFGGITMFGDSKATKNLPTPSATFSHWKEKILDVLSGEKDNLGPINIERPR